MARLFLGALLVCSVASLRVLHLISDDWNRGHELPDVVSGRLFGALVFVRVENTGKEWARSVSLSVKGSQYLTATHGIPVDLAPGQATSLYSPIVLQTEVPSSTCPLHVRLRVESASESTAGGKEVDVRLLCRRLDDRITFIYLDVDGSPQIAGAKFPAAACPAKGCGVLLSTHGMDVTAQRQADCYRRKSTAWVLAPHGRGTHGYNWQGPPPLLTVLHLSVY